MNITAKPLFVNIFLNGKVSLCFCALLDVSNKLTLMPKSNWVTVVRFQVMDRRSRGADLQFLGNSPGVTIF